MFRARDATCHFLFVTRPNHMLHAPISEGTEAPYSTKCACTYAQL